MGLFEFLMFVLVLVGFLAPLARWQVERDMLRSSALSRDEERPPDDGDESADPLKDHPFARPRKFAKGRRILELFTTHR